MKFFTTEESKLWCEARGLQVTPDRYLHYELDKSHCFTVPLEEKPSRVIALADYFVPTWAEVPFEGALVWIRERGIWGEYSETTGSMIVEQMRLANGEREPVETRPGHLFEPSELVQMHSYVVVPMLFGWDAFVVPQSGDYFIFVSHDGVAAIVARTADKVNGLWQRVQSWNPKEDKSWYPRIASSQR